MDKSAQSVSTINSHSIYEMVSFPTAYLNIHILIFLFWLLSPIKFSTFFAGLCFLCLLEDFWHLCSSLTL